jgi:hypothetical protein
MNEMFQKELSDFQRGYYYASRRHVELLAEKSLEDILMLAMVFNQSTGIDAELMWGMGAYYLETGIKRILGSRFASRITTGIIH